MFPQSGDILHGDILASSLGKINSIVLTLLMGDPILNCFASGFRSLCHSTSSLLL